MLKFEKYQGTGNDFILLYHETALAKDWDASFIPSWCDRRFGIGADGLIVVAPHSEYDFEMRYFNADGSRSFCGNGARCAVKFAASKGLFKEKANFLAIDGVHYAELMDNGVRLQMSPVKKWERNDTHFVLNTGSPHFVQFVSELTGCNIVAKGKAVRYSEKYAKEGINVNLVEVLNDNELSILTYERGVEDETLSCGTGATAAALAHVLQNQNEGKFHIDVHVKGGKLSVRGEKNKNGFEAVFLEGPATFVFSGEMNKG